MVAYTPKDLVRKLMSIRRSYYDRRLLLETVKVFFKQLQHNNNRYIEAAEVYRIMTGRSNNLNDEDARMLVSLVNSDDSESIRVQDFIRFVTSTCFCTFEDFDLKEVLEALTVLDNLSAAALCQMCSRIMDYSNEEVNETMRKINDVDGDGQIDYEELVNKLST